MKILAVYPSGLMYAKVYLRLEPLGLELIAQTLRYAGHEVKLIDLQVTTQRAYIDEIKGWRPDVIAISCNTLAHTPEVIDLAKTAKQIINDSFVVVGGHCASFTAEELLEHGQGAIDCVLKGEGETTILPLIEAIQHDHKSISQVPGVVSDQGCGPLPVLARSLDEILPARDLLRYPRRYFVSELDPAASIELSRGCPWDCSFCSAWTFYNRNYRLKSPEVAVEELSRIKEHGVFIVDDVAFLHKNHGLEIGEAIARKGIKKEYVIETRCDVLLRNKEVFKFWKEIGLSYMYLGMEAMDDEGLNNFRKRIKKDLNFEALEFARSLGIVVGVNLIVDPNWDRQRFEAVRQWCREISDCFVNFPVFTPYPGTETWYTESRQLITRDYRLFDLQHSVLLTKLPLADFYEELIKTQIEPFEKLLRFPGFLMAAPYLIRNLLRGQTNLFKLLFNYKKVFHPGTLLADHDNPVAYELRLPPKPAEKIDPHLLYIHKAQEASSVS